MMTEIEACCVPRASNFFFGKQKMLKTQQHQVVSKQMKILTRSHVNMYSEIETHYVELNFY